MRSATRENSAVILMIFVAGRTAVQRVPSAAGESATRGPVNVPVAGAWIHMGKDPEGSLTNKKSAREGLPGSGTLTVIVSPYLP
jgi:hypothetical protein